MVEFEFHSDLYNALKERVHSDDEERFDEISGEKSTKGRKKADIFVDSYSTGSLVIEVKDVGINIRSPEVISQAREYAEELESEYFAVCNPNSFFIFENDDDAISVQDLDIYSLYTADMKPEDYIDEVLDVVDRHYNTRETPEQDDKDLALAYMDSYFENLWRSFGKTVRIDFKSNMSKRRSIIDWAVQNGYVGYFEDSENIDFENKNSTQLAQELGVEDVKDREFFEIFAQQQIYLLMSRILFYSSIKSRTPDEIPTESGNSLPNFGKIKTKTRKDIGEVLRERFRRIIEEIDYEPIFGSGDNFYEQISANKKTRSTLVQYTEDIEKIDVGKIDEDFLGDIYQRLLTSERRKKLGQFYTPDSIAETITRWCIDSGDDCVLDPACGSGTFTVKSYNMLEGSHQERINKIASVDINRFSSHLTGVNLVSQNPEKVTERLNVYTDSFFNVGPKPYNSTEQKQEQSLDIGQISPFDSVIGNPPYIRQELINKKEYRNHLTDESDIDGRSDAYVYFTTYATEFLKDGGKLGYIIPNKWMMTDYGEDFRDFLYNNYSIQAVIGFNELAFEDALVDTVMLLMEKEPSFDKRVDNNVTFMYLKEPVSPRNIIDNIEFEYSKEGISSTWNQDKFRTTVVDQEYLMNNPDKKLKEYMQTPVAVKKVLKNNSMTQLGEQADIGRGETTGANKFFFIKEKEARERGINERFLKPAVRSIRYINGKVISEGDVDRYIIDMEDYVQEISDQVSEVSEENIKKALERDGYKGILQYIEEGEEKGHNDGKMCSNRDIWFNLGELVNSKVIHPQNFHEEIFAIELDRGIGISNTLYTVETGDEKLDNLILAIMNSTLYNIILETEGRESAGGSIRATVSDLRDITFPDLSKISEKDKDNIIKIYKNLKSGSSSKKDLDNAVLRSIEGLNMSEEELYKAWEEQASKRLNKEVENLVDKSNL